MNKEVSLLADTIYTLRRLRKAAVTAQTDLDAIAHLHAAKIVSVEAAECILQTANSLDPYDVLSKQLQLRHSIQGQEGRWMNDRFERAKVIYEVIEDNTEPTVKATTKLQTRLREMKVDLQIRGDVLNPGLFFLGILSTGFLELTVLATFLAHASNPVHLSYAPIAVSRDLQVAVVPPIPSTYTTVVLYDEYRTSEGLTINTCADFVRALHTNQKQVYPRK